MTSFPATRLTAGRGFLAAQWCTLAGCRPTAACAVLLTALAFILATGTRPATAATIPGLGDPVRANGEPVQIEILTSDATFTSDIFLVRQLTVQVRKHLATSREAGKVITLQPFRAGEELIFEISVRETGQSFQTGPGFRNPDGRAHAVVTATSPTTVKVAFEDSFGGGDEDFNDVVLEVRMATAKSGLDHRRLGGADLGHDAEGNLVLSNLSGSGRDGMAVILGEATGWSLNPFEADLDSASGNLNLALNGSRDGQEQQPLGAARLQLADRIVRLFPDFSSLGATTTEVTLFGDHGQRLSSFLLGPGEPIGFLCPSSFFDFLLNIAARVTVSPGFPGGSRSVTIIIDGIEVTECTLVPDFIVGQEDRGRSSTATASPPPLWSDWSDLVRAVAVTAVDPAFSPDFLSEAVLTTEGLRSLSIAGEAVQFAVDGPFHSGVGRATLEPAAGTLTVGHLGTSGTDGVVIDPGRPVEKLETPYIPVPPPAQLAEGAFLEFGTRGLAGAAGERELGALRLTAAGGQVELTADYSPLGCRDQRVLVFDDGEIVADVTGHSGVVGRVGDWPSTVASGRFRPEVQPQWGYSLHFADDETIDLEAGPVVTGDTVLILVEDPLLPVTAVSKLRLQASGVRSITLLPEKVTPLLPGPCAPDPQRLCLNRNRFAVDVTWRDAAGNLNRAQAVPLTGDGGAFWLFAPENLEVAVKVLDGRAVNGHWWVFVAGLTDLEYSVVVTDAQTGAVKTYPNARGSFSSRGDVEAFADAGAAAGDAEQRSGGTRPEDPSQLAGDATPGEGSDLLLHGELFAVEVIWVDRLGQTQRASAVPVTSQAGYFWFFQSENPEIFIKVLDGRPLNGHWWVFFGGLSDLGYTINVINKVNGETKTYTNPPGRFGSAGDTRAFSG